MAEERKNETEGLELMRIPKLRKRLETIESQGTTQELSNEQIEPVASAAGKKLAKIKRAKYVKGSMSSFYLLLAIFCVS